MGRTSVVFTYNRQLCKNQCYITNGETDTLFAFLHYPQCVFCPVLTSSTQPIAADGSPSLSLVLAEIQ